MIYSFLVYGPVVHLHTVFFVVSILRLRSSVADPDPFDPDPDNAFHFDTDPDPTV